MDPVPFPNPVYDLLRGNERDSVIQWQKYKLILFVTTRKIHVVLPTSSYNGEEGS